MALRSPFLRWFPVLGCSLCGIVLTFAVLPAIVAQVAGPLDLKQVTVLATSESVSDERFETLVRSRGVSFEVTDGIVRELLKQGASIAKCKILLAAPQPLPPAPRRET